MKSLKNNQGNTLLIGLAIVGLLIVGAFTVFSLSSDTEISTNDDAMVEEKDDAPSAPLPSDSLGTGGAGMMEEKTDEAMMEDDKTDEAMMEEKTDEAMMEDDKTDEAMMEEKTDDAPSAPLGAGMMEEKTDDAMMEEKKDDAMMEDDKTSQSANAVYTAFSPASFEEAKGTKRVLFFHAAWCPTCKSANQDIEDNMDQLPDGLSLFKTDYDTEKDLIKKYGITYQHTFVQVDANGDAITKWNGGGAETIAAKLQ